jgi:hypothetical protein
VDGTRYEGAFAKDKRHGERKREGGREGGRREGGGWRGKDSS